MQALRLARGLMDDHGLGDWTVTLDNALTRAGQCRYAEREISLSKPLMADRSHEETLDTILHEMAHALVGHAHGHDEVWAAKHRALGGNGQRCFAYTDDASPWVGECGHGVQISRYREPKRLYGWRCRCPQGSTPVVWRERITIENTYEYVR